MFLHAEPGAGLIRYELLPGEPVDEFTLEVLRQNTPEGVLMLGRETNEEGDHLLLPVAGLVPVLSEESILVNIFIENKFLTEIKTIQSSLRDHMIPEWELVLRPEWTWVRPETGAPVLLVLPTPAARDLSLSMDAYETLVSAIYAKRRQIAEESAGETERHAGQSAKGSAKAGARRRGPAKPWRLVVRDFWENLD